MFTALQVARHNPLQYPPSASEARMTPKLKERPRASASESERASSHVRRPLRVPDAMEVREAALIGRRRRRGGGGDDDNDTAAVRRSTGAALINVRLLACLYTEGPTPSV